jgi:hypothetical protein
MLTLPSLGIYRKCRPELSERRIRRTILVRQQWSLDMMTVFWKDGYTLLYEFAIVSTIDPLPQFAVWLRISNKPHFSSLFIFLLECYYYLKE